MGWPKSDRMKQWMGLETVVEKRKVDVVMIAFQK